MKLLRTLLMVVVGIIILLHTLIPHRHFQRAGETLSLHAHDCQVNLLEDIQLSFSIDHGIGHFEHYLEVDQPELDFPLPATTLRPGLFIASNFVPAEFEKSYIGAQIGSALLRGPPKV